MAKPTKYATLISSIVTIFAIIGIIIGILTLKSLVIILLLLPAVVYEVYRTEGESTRWASWVLLLVLVLEIVLIAANVSFNLASFLGRSEATVAGYRVPLGDIKIVGPFVMGILAVILFVRTYGRFTKWLAAVIFISSLALIYTINPNIISSIINLVIEQSS
ncbi:MAG: hypothetical protein M1371_03005 [Actinobacteria bacterium]|nr:hypothetical protein [Actinomycetota bacterium]MCL5985514.1 hypothetical protein [Actinomycetota bacterium]